MAPRLPEKNGIPGSAGPEILSLFAVSFLIGLQLASTFPGLSFWYFVFLGCVFSGMAYGVQIRGVAGWVPLIGLGIAVGGFVYSYRFEDRIPWETLRKIDNLEGELKGTFVGEFKFLKRGGVTLKMESVIFEAASMTYELPGNVRVDVNDVALLPEPGQKYAASGTLRVIRGRAFPQFSTARLIQTSEMNILGPFIGGLQRWVRDGTSSLLTSRHQSIVVGLLLGDTSGLSLEDRKLFKESGLSHVLAVSGQHIIILAFLLISVLTWFGIPPLSRCFLTILFLLVYGLVTSGQPSVWRAIVMYIVGVFSIHWEANPGPIRPVALSALLLLLFQPQWVHHIGFQLSFLAVIGILLGRPPIETLLLRLKFPLILSRYLAVSFAANLAVLPLAFYYFGFISLVSFVLNPLLVWSFSLILPMSIALAVSGHMWFSGGVALSAALSLLLDGFLKTVEVFCRLPLATIEPGPLPGFLISLLYGGMLYIIYDLHFAYVEITAMGKEVNIRKTSVIEQKKSEKNSKKDEKKIREVLPDILNEQHFVEIIDHQISSIPKRSLKSSGNIEMVSFPVKKLSVEGQTLFYRLDDLSRDVLKLDPERILLANVFALALLASEISFRLFGRLVPPPVPGELVAKCKARNRHVALILLLESFFQSTLPARLTDPALADLMGRAQQLHHQGKTMLANLLRERDLAMIPTQLAFRQSVLEWCRETIQTVETETPS